MATDRCLVNGRTLVYDDVGSGGLPMFAEDAKQLADRLGLTHPVAIALAAMYPDFPHSLVVLDAVFEVTPESRRALQAFYDSLTAANYGAVVGAFVRDQLCAPGDDPELVEAAVEMMTALPLEVFAALGRGRLAYDGVAAARAVTVPSLFIASARPFADLVSLRQHCRDWYLGRVVGSGHKLQLMVPDQVNAMIDRFLGQVAAGYGREDQDNSF